MKIGLLQSVDFDAFLEFNRTAYPERVDIAGYFDLSVLQNPFLKDKKNTHCLIAVDDSERIIGQLPLNPMECYLKGKSTPCHIGFDFYVEEQFRNTGAGALLAYQGIQGFKPYFGIGPSETARLISESLKATCIGKMCKWIWFRNPFRILKILSGPFSAGKKPTSHHSDPTDRLPQNIGNRYGTFQRTESSKMIADGPWSDKVISFSRSPAVLDWRFMNRERVALYHSTDNVSSYFVVREGSWKGMNWLILLDYRIPPDQPDTFTAILSAVKTISRTLRTDGILTMSSFHSFDSFLMKNRFLKVGKPILIMSNIKLSCSSSDILNNNCIITTMADSDIEFNSGIS